MTREQHAVLGTLETYPGMALSTADVVDETGLDPRTVSHILSKFALSYVAHRDLQVNAMGRAVWHYWVPERFIERPQREEKTYVSVQPRGS